MTLKEWVDKNVENGLLTVVSANKIYANFDLEQDLAEWASKLRYNDLMRLTGVGRRTTANILSVLAISGHKIPNYHYGD